MTKSEPRDLEVIALEKLALAHEASVGDQSTTEAMAVVFRILRLTSRMNQDFETHVYRPLGLSSAGFTILFVLRVVGALEPRDLARVIGVTRASISSALNTLERDGLVERRRESNDRRVVTVMLTESGRALAARSSVLQHEREEAWVSALTVQERRQLADQLERLGHGPEPE